MWKYYRCKSVKYAIIIFNIYRFKKKRELLLYDNSIYGKSITNNNSNPIDLNINDSNIFYKSDSVKK